MYRLDFNPEGNLINYYLFNTWEEAVKTILKMTHNYYSLKKNLVYNND